MKFIIKFTSSVLIIFTIYVVCVFVFPSKTDNIAKNI